MQFKCLEAGTKKSEEGELNYDLTNFVEETKIIIKECKESEFWATFFDIFSNGNKNNLIKRVSILKNLYNE